MEPVGVVIGADLVLNSERTHCWVQSGQCFRTRLWVARHCFLHSSLIVHKSASFRLYIFFRSLGRFCYAVQCAMRFDLKCGQCPFIQMMARYFTTALICFLNFVFGFCPCGQYLAASAHSFRCFSRRSGASRTTLHSYKNAWRAFFLER